MVRKERVATETVRLRKRVHEDEEVLDVPVQTEAIEVERVPVGRWIDAPADVRHEGDTTVYPVVEEVLVAEKRLRLVEEVRVTRRQDDAPECRSGSGCAARRSSSSATRLPAVRTATLESDPAPIGPDGTTTTSTQRGEFTMTAFTIGLFESREAAQQVRAALVEAGCDKDSVAIFGNEAGDKLTQFLGERGFEASAPACTPRRSGGAACWSPPRPRTPTRPWR